jgi:hypothetical protein
MSNTAIAKPYKLTAPDKERMSWLLNAGQEDTERIARDMKGTEADVAILTQAIATEKASDKPRAGRLKIMESKLRALTKSAKTLPLQGESKGPDWSRARAILDGIKTCIRLSLAGQVLLGMELQTIKVELGFAGSGRRKEKGNDFAFKSLNRTWEQWVKSELGISDRGADNFIACYEAAKQRVKKLGGDKQLTGLLATHPAQLSKESHKILSGMVDKLVWGETQKTLLEELKLVKFQAALPGGANGKTKPTKEEVAQQMAFDFFTPAAAKAAKIAKEISSLRIKQDYSLFLHQLEVASEDPKALTLDTLELTQQALIADAQAFLADIKKAKAAKEKANAA